MTDPTRRTSGTTGARPSTPRTTPEPGLGRVADRLDERIDDPRWRDQRYDARHDAMDHRCPVQTAAAVVGTAFVLVGIAGFVPGITQDLGDIEFAGHESAAELFGVFQVSVLHNLVHLLFGIVGLAAARRMSAARSYLVVGGLIYLALAVYGAVVDEQSDANVVPVDEADDWLHLGLGLGMIAVGAALWRHRTHTVVDHMRPAGSTIR